MYGRIILFIAATLYYSGLVGLGRWWAGRRGPRLIILMYHRTAGGRLREHLLHLRRHYRLLPLETALEELYKPRTIGHSRRDRRPLLAITFDDGYYDTYTDAFAVVRELQVPITVFVIPGYVQSGDHFWWLERYRLPLRARVVDARIMGHVYRLDREDERVALARAIDRGARYARSVAEREAFLTAARTTLAVPAVTEEDEKSVRPITWSEVHEMDASGLVTIGAHTMHHPILGYLTNPAEVRREVRECRTVLARQLGHAVRTFAYPVGKLEHIGSVGMLAVQEAGYAWAVSTLDGCNTPRTHPYLLRRIGVDSMQHWWIVEAKVSGVWDAVFGPLRWLRGRFQMVSGRDASRFKRLRAN